MYISSSFEVIFVIPWIYLIYLPKYVMRNSRWKYCCNNILLWFFLQKISDVSKPNLDWGPKEKATREVWEQTPTPSFIGRCLDLVIDFIFFIFFFIYFK